MRNISLRDGKQNEWIRQRIEVYNIIKKLLGATRLTKIRIRSFIMPTAMFTY